MFRVVRRCGAAGWSARRRRWPSCSTQHRTGAQLWLPRESPLCVLHPMAIEAGLRRARVPFMTGSSSCAVKEDAIFRRRAFQRRWRSPGRADEPRRGVLFLVAPPTPLWATWRLLRVVVRIGTGPQGDGLSLGPPRADAMACARRCVGPRCRWGAITSGFLGLVLSRHLYLPLLGWRG